jgi:hypothetical protein
VAGDGILTRCRICCQYAVTVHLKSWTSPLRRSEQVILYLLTMKNHWLTCGGYRKAIVEGYSDVDRGEKHDWHSVSGYLFHMGQGAVTWSSKKQHIITLSCTEAKYIVQTHATKETLWIRTFIGEFCEGFRSLS